MPKRRRLTPDGAIPLLAIALVLCLASAASAHTETPEGATELWALHYIQRWARSQGLAPPLPSSAIIAAARDNSHALSEVGGSAPAGASAYLRAALERRAVYDAITPAVALVGRTRVDLEPGLARFVRRHLARHGARGRGRPAASMATVGPTHVGVGVSTTPDGRQVLTVVMAHRLVSLQPVRPHLGRAFRVCGRLARRRALLARRAHARVLVKTPDGDVQTRAVRGPRFCARFPAPSLRGEHIVEVMVDTRRGPQVAALFGVQVGRRRALPVAKLYPRAIANSPAAIAAKLFAMIAATRRDHGLPPFVPSPALAAVARRHSQAMRRYAFFGHVGPHGTTLAQRLAALRVHYSAAGENLALATSAQRAHDSLMRSPSHRKLLLDARMTHVGIGVADGPRGLHYITQCFAALVAAPPQARPAVR